MIGRLRARIDGLRGAVRALRDGVAPAGEGGVPRSPAPSAVAAPAVAAPVVAAPVVAAPAAASPSAAAPSPPALPSAPPARLYADTGSTDLAAYQARAKAAGRDASELRGGEGVNVAEDGVAYVGPLDNESSRAKAAGRVLSIDPWECISCGTCVEQTDRVFALPDDGKATPIAQDGPMDLIQEAIDACPVTCIRWVTAKEARERGLHTGT